VTGPRAPRPTNPHLTAATAAGDAAHIDVEWDAGNDQWWDWYMSLADDDGATGPIVTGPRWDPGPLPDDEQLRVELATPYELPEAAVRDFATDGFVKLPDVLSPGAVERLRGRLRQLLDDAVDPAVGFQSLEMMWLTDPVVRAAVLSPRIGRLCAQLLEVDAVRLYHDNALSKEPGAGRTPWHYDAHHFPLATSAAVTAWAPLQPTPREMGPLAFARGSDLWETVAQLAFDKHDTSYDRAVAAHLRAAAATVEDGPFALGEVSFHAARCLHTAGANRTDVPRMALATTYFADGTRVVDQPTMISGDWRKFLPGVGAGELAVSDRNPIVG
jgi:hypothetical protein